MSRHDAADLSQRLGRCAEAVCRRYLAAGRRQGHYWLVGDVRNTPGRSLFVRLRDSSKGPAGRWRDAATGESGDLLDIIRLALGLKDFANVANEARAFLSLPQPEPVQLPQRYPHARSGPVAGSIEAARRLFALSRPIDGTLAARYLRRRGVTIQQELTSLRFHPRCYYRSDAHEPTRTWPAMIAAVSNLSGAITGAHRTWLSPDGAGKAPVDTPRKAMGELLGHAVRFGLAGDVMAVGEGIESVLSVREALPAMATAAALSAAHLAAIHFPETLRRLYILCDNDPAGDSASDVLIQRADAAGIEAIALSPLRGDFNEDLCADGVEALRAHLRSRLAPQDVARFMRTAA